MKQVKLFRKLNHLLRLNLFLIERIRYPENVDVDHWHRREAKSAWFEILDLIKRLQISVSEVIDLGQTLRAEKFEAKNIYKKRPIVQRRDNKDRTVGSRGSNRNKIRFPKKVRKLLGRDSTSYFQN